MKLCIRFFILFILVLSAGTDTVPYKAGPFPQEVAVRYGVEDGIPSMNVSRVLVAPDGLVYAVAAGQFVVLETGAWRKLDFLPEDAVQAAVLDEAMLEQQWIRAIGENTMADNYAFTPGRPIVVKTRTGLREHQEDRTSTELVIEDGLGRRWATSDIRAVAYDSLGQLWFATLAGVGCREESGWKFYTGAEGLPYNDFTCMAAGPDGVMWFGTKKGAIRFEDGEWHYRQGPGWLPHDEVRHIAVDKAGNAWFATPKGVGCIERRMMTLAEKAAHYEAEVETYIKRTPFGYTSEVHFPEAGVRENTIYSDSDNDGLWTGMYGTGECFAYAATGDPKAKERAKQAFEALRFLQKVTQTGDIRPPKGYVARTVIPTDWPDPNEGRLERDREKKAAGDSLWKLYEPRWPKSGDGKWYWKSDTSSDELDGHYFFYPAYYDLVADTPEEKERVREVVRDLTDHIMTHGFNMVDHDGAPTRWAIYGPDSLNNDPNWWSERGLKSISILSYLAVAEHMTGDPKYGAAARELVDKHGYRANAMWYKVHFGPGSGNQSDDEMAFMSYYNFMKYGKGETLRQEMLYSFYSAWTVEQPEMNPFFNFCYAAFGRGAKHTNPWGTHPISPWKGWLDDSMKTLMGFPLDRLDWTKENSHRLDLVMLPRQQASEPYEPARRDRGYLVNGKVLPVENRHFNHWNTDPWRLDYRGNGRTLGNGAVFLLPYYMGLYHGFIEESP